MPPKSLAERVDALEKQLEAALKRIATLEGKTPTKKSKGTLDEVLAFCESIGLPATDAEWFFEKCEGNGWKNGGKPILNWQATIRAWKLSHYLPSQKQPESSHYARRQAPPQNTTGDLNSRDRYSKR